MGDPRHVLMTADCLGGVWDYSLTLARELTIRGTRVSVAVLGGPLSPDQRAEAGTISGLALADSAWKLEWMPDCGVDLDLSSRWLLDLARDLKPDLVHVNGYAHAALPFGVPTVCAAHSCVAGWFATVKGEEPPVSYDRYLDGVVAGLAAASAVVAPTRAMAASLALHHGFVGDVAVIPNGIDAARFAAGPKSPLVLTAGRVWDEAKNIALLDGVAPGLTAPVLVAGEGTGPDGRTYGLSHAVGLGRLGREELAALYARAAIFCLPARYEPFGLAPLEAALSGCALVLGDIPSLREVWGDAATYVRPDDALGLKRALNGLLADPARLADRANAARIRAARFTSRAMAEGYLDLYAALLTAVPDTAARPAAA